ncbi:MAG TPA: hypothetical protein PLJ27_11300, partial [Polyangiaceae bacterium]|nr:hypothetical protein [Polyangiaceae bacterium]
MNQPPGNFDPPDDGYGGMGRRGGTIPGGPPMDFSELGPQAAIPEGGAATPSFTMVDASVAPGIMPGST